MVTSTDIQWQDASNPPAHKKWVLITTGRRDVLVGFHDDGKWYINEGTPIDGVISWQPWPGSNSRMKVAE